MARDNEYVVEKVLKAIVHYKRNKKIVWKYLVKWEGYEETDNTWEPEDSFKGTSLLRTFWQNADNGGRDIGDASQFRVGEEFTADSRRRVVSSASRGASAKRTRTTSAKRGAPAQEDTSDAPKKRARTSRAGPKKKSANDENDNEESVSAGGPRRSKRRNPANANSSVSDDEEENMDSDEEEDRGSSAPTGRQRTSTQRARAASSSDRRRSKASKRMREDEDEAEEDEEEKATSSKSQSPARTTSRGKKREPTSISEEEQSSDDKPLVPSPRRPRKAPITQYKSSASRHKRRKSNVVTSDDEDEDAEGETDYDEMSTLKAEVVITGSASSRKPVPEERRSVSPGGSLFSEAGVEATTSTPVASDHPEKALSPEVPVQTRHKTPPLPPHRARAAKPLVKFIDDPRIMQSVKAKLSKHDALSEAVPQSPVVDNVHNSGPSMSVNRPSLLTATKGHLTTQRGEYAHVNGATAADATRGASETPDAEAAANSNGNAAADSGEDMQDVFMEIEAMSTEPAIVQPPSGDELLRLAGLDGQGNDDLPDFDADAEGIDDYDVLVTHNEEVVMSASTGASTSGLMSFGEPTGVLSTATGGAWRIGTIFEPATPVSMKSGPFVSGSSNDGIPPSKLILSLRLDSSNSVPVMLKDVQASKSDPTQRLTDLLSTQLSGPPGKLHVDGVLDCVSSGGSSARLAVDESADATQVNNYQQLLEQLNGGKLFIAALGGSVLVMLASQNRAAGEKLGIAGVLLGLSQTAVVSHVSIENDSAYANYAMDAEDLILT